MNSFKSGFVSIIGKPNVGKSTMINAFIQEKIAITSSKPQTTRNVIRGILTCDDCQIIFLDTPGMHQPKSKLGTYMMNSSLEHFSGVDVILYVISAPNEKNQKVEEDWFLKLKKVNIPVFLIINKVDLVAKEQLLPIMQRYKEMMNFHSIIPISALKSDNVDAIIEEVRPFLKEGPQFFPSDSVTDQPERVIVGEMIREKMLKNLNDEVPHGVGVEVVSFKEDEEKKLISLVATIYCERDTHKGIIIGKKGMMLKKIGMEARLEIERFLASKVFLELFVKVKPDWKNNKHILKTLGYNKKD